MIENFFFVGGWTESQQDRINKQLQNVTSYSFMPTLPTILPKQSAVIVRSGVSIPAAPEILAVRSAGSGMDNITLRPGLEVSNQPGLNAAAVAAHAVSMHHELTDGSCKSERIAILGAGFVATRTALLFRALGHDVGIFQRPSAEHLPENELGITTDLEGLLRMSSTLIYAASGTEVVPLGQLMKWMKGFSTQHPAKVINVARAHAFVANQAQQDCLESNPRLRIATDVWHQEPQSGELLPQSMADALLGLAGKRSVIGTMHVAGRHPLAEDRMADESIKWVKAKIVGIVNAIGGNDPLELLRTHKPESLAITSNLIAGSVDLLRYTLQRNHLLQLAERSVKDGPVGFSHLLGIDTAESTGVHFATLINSL